VSSARPVIEETSAEVHAPKAVGTRSERASAPSPSTHGATSAPSAAPPPADASTPVLHQLAVSGFENAVVALPLGERQAPLLVATHGAGGDPNWECERWGRVARGRWLVACPRGVPLRRGEEGSYYYPDHHALEREVSAVTRAVRTTYGALVAERDGVYLGYSQGATMGALMVVDQGAEFPHLVLIEGGSGDWTIKRAERFRSSGGKSVFIICGTEPCARRAAASAVTLERAGLTVVTRYAAGAGHTELDAVGTHAAALLETLAISSP
jgi:predicted esterase